MRRPGVSSRASAPPVVIATMPRMLVSRAAPSKAMPAATAPFSSERYVIAERIGEGGMGVVYRARDVRTGAPVALKTVTHMDPTTLLRFKNEWRALADISHPNVVQLYELVSEHGVWFFTMEL